MDTTSNLLLNYLSGDISTKVEINKLKSITNTIIDKKNKIDTANNYGSTTLHLLCEKRTLTLEMLIFLVEKYIEVNASIFTLNKYDEEPFTFLCCNKNCTKEMLEYFINKYNIYKRNLPIEIISSIASRNPTLLYIIVPYFTIEDFETQLIEHEIDDKILEEFNNYKIDF